MERTFPAHPHPSPSRARSAPGRLLALALWAPAVGLAQTTPTPPAPLEQQRATLEAQASEAYEAGRYEAAMDAARSAIELDSGAATMAELSSWVILARAAEQRGDLEEMARALDGWASIPDLNATQVERIEKQRVVLEFHEAERSGQIERAAAQLDRVKRQAIAKAEWIAGAQRRLDVRAQLRAGRIDAALAALAVEAERGGGSTIWAERVSLEVQARAEQGRCELDKAASRLATLSADPTLTPGEARRVTLLREQVAAQRALAAGNTTAATAALKRFEDEGSLTAAEQSWLNLGQTHLDLNVAWASCDLTQLNVLRGAYTALAEKLPPEPACPAPPWADPKAECVKPPEAPIVEPEKPDPDRDRDKGSGEEGRVHLVWFGAAGLSALAAGGAVGAAAWYGVQIQDGQSAIIDKPYEACAGDPAEVKQKCSDSVSTDIDALEVHYRRGRTALHYIAPAAGAAALTFTTIGLVVRF